MERRSHHLARAVVILLRSRLERHRMPPASATVRLPARLGERLWSGTPRAAGTVCDTGGHMSRMPAALRSPLCRRQRLPPDPCYLRDLSHGTTSLPLKRRNSVRKDYRSGRGARQLRDHRIATGWRDRAQQSHSGPFVGLEKNVATRCVISPLASIYCL
jgi:hypothetical protein